MMNRHALELAVLAALPTFAPLAAATATVAGDELAKLLPATGQAYERAGVCVAVSGSTALVGGSGEHFTTEVPGVAFLFDLASGQEVARLQPAGVAPHDEYGSAVALAAGRAFVGAPFDSESAQYAGAVYVFDATTGQPLDKLFPSGSSPSSYYGQSLAADGGLLLVGARAERAAYLIDAASGQELLRMSPGPPAGDNFAASVALWGTTALIGAPGDDENGTNAGAAWLFDTTTGQPIFKLLASDGIAYDSFGAAVAIGPGGVVVGAPKFGAMNFNHGAAYLFDPATGVELGKLARNDDPAFHYFGGSVAMQGTTAAVGAVGAGPHAGAVYLFDTSTAWQIAKLYAGDGQESDYLGSSVAIDGSTVVAGARGDDDNGTESGSAYVFDAVEGTAVPYCFGDGSATPCPCANAGADGCGCANSAFPAGAKLYVIEAAHVVVDDLTLFVRDTRQHQMGLFFQGDQAVAGGQGVAFGDGLRCAGGAVVRLELVQAGPTGACTSTAPIATTGGVMPGDVRRYQWWYRDPGTSPCGSGFNLSNALEITWCP